jgi:CDGSH-type Zn-finger protein
MNTPKRAGDAPIPVEIKEGQTYYWCACGLSSKQPFCSGAHAGTAFTPMAFTATESGTKYMCNCKVTANKPFCDGSHLK